MSQLVFPIKLSSEDACWDPRTRNSSSSSSRGLVACVLQFWCTTQYSTFSQELQRSQTQNERALYWGHLGSTLLSRGSKVTSFAPYSTSSGSTAAIFYSPDRSFDGGGGGGSMTWCRRRYLQEETEGENLPQQVSQGGENCMNKWAHGQLCLEHKKKNVWIIYQSSWCAWCTLSRPIWSKVKHDVLVHGEEQQVRWVQGTTAAQHVFQVEVTEELREFFYCLCSVSWRDFPKNNLPQRVVCPAHVCVYVCVCAEVNYPGV